MLSVNLETLRHDPAVRSAYDERTLNRIVGALMDLQGRRDSEAMIKMDWRSYRGATGRGASGDAQVTVPVGSSPSGYSTSVIE